MELKLVMVVMQLIDVCTVPLGDGPHLIIVEQAGEVDESAKYMQTTWQDFSYSVKTDNWEKESSITYSIPYGNAISIVRKNDAWLSVVEANMNDALILCSTVADGNPSIYLPINLSRDSWSKINIPPRGEWSTLYLPTKKHLFSPYLQTLDKKETIVIANAPDASARILAAGEKIEELGSIDRCLEPRILLNGENKMVFARRCPAEWSVFFNLPQTRNVPQLLPLYAYKLDKDYTVNTVINLSKGWDTGASFGFDVCMTADGALFLASVTGLLKKPYLHILSSFDYGDTWSEQKVIPLESIPQKVMVSSAGNKILTACSFNHHDGFHVMAAEFDR